MHNTFFVTTEKSLHLFSTSSIEFYHFAELAIIQKDNHIVNLNSALYILEKQASAF